VYVVGFLVRLLFVALLARLFMRLLRVVQGRGQRDQRKSRAEIPPHLRDDIVDGEFEEVPSERKQ